MNKEKVIQSIVKDADEVIDYETTNQIMKSNFESIDFEVSKKTIQNIAKWALNGSSSNDIAKNLELTKKEFKVICSVCPAITYAMQRGHQLAEVMLVGSAFDFAIGNKWISEEKLVMIKEYNENGRVVGEHPETRIVKRQLPPNADMLKYLMNGKLGENFGNDKIDNSQRMKQIVAELTPEELETVEKELGANNG